ncbi:hypothetical protein BDR07DRAFT_788090 [Suillus spraguei]|nr:hypothetical protein BDR07DRAFT_788090 [Suillus spraguei]
MLVRSFISLRLRHAEGLCSNLPLLFFGISHTYGMRLPTLHMAECYAQAMVAFIYKWTVCRNNCGSIPELLGEIFFNIFRFVLLLVQATQSPARVCGANLSLYTIQGSGSRCDQVEQLGSTSVTSQCGC